MPRDVVGREALELRRAFRHDCPKVGPNVPIELLSDDDELVAQGLDALTGRLVLVDAGQPEVAKGALDVVPRLGIGVMEVDGGQRVVHTAVQGELGLKGADPL